MRFLFKILFPLLFLSCATKENLDVSEFPIITSVAELSEYYGLNLDSSGKYESLTATRYFDGSKDLDYMYELAETTTFDPLYYYVTITQESSMGDARNSYNLSKKAFSLVGNSFDQEIIQIDSLDLPGDEYYYALRTYEGLPNGMYYTVRKGTRIYTMTISGLYSSDHSLLYDLILPRIENLETYQIKY